MSRRCSVSLTRIGLYADKLDGKAGMKTRAALGAYQKSAGLKVDCWPSEAVLRSIERGAINLLQRKNPAEASAGFSKIEARRIGAGQISCRPGRGGSASRNHPRSAGAANGRAGGGASST